MVIKQVIAKQIRSYLLIFTTMQKKLLGFSSIFVYNCPILLLFGSCCNGVNSNCIFIFLGEVEKC